MNHPTISFRWSSYQATALRSPPRSRSKLPTRSKTSLEIRRGDDIDVTPTLSFASYDDLLETITPRVLDLIEAVRREEPASINETARVVDRDVKNVHEELSRLAMLGIIYFEENGRSKRPVVWFDELVIELPFEPDAGDIATTAP